MVRWNGEQMGMRLSLSAPVPIVTGVKETFMPVTAVVGAQWGDEGKGHIVDFLAAKAHLVVRFQGGNNAGHTVVNPHGKFALHLIPCGIFYPHVHNVLGAGMVINPQALLDEMRTLAAKGISFTPARFHISERAHVVMPYHILFDQLEEEARGAKKQGTTKQGVGPCYADKAARVGVRMGDLTDEHFLRDYLADIVALKNTVLTRIYHHPPLDYQELLEQALAWGKALGPYIKNTHPLMQQAVREDKQILLEGQLGAMRDLDWGIYPYVTSSSPIAGGASSGAGIPPHRITNVIGVVKAYTTAVGEGPVPAELNDETGKLLREVGEEYGATTGRPRRCGWFDAVATRYAAELCGFSSIAITKIDVLDHMPLINICIGYDIEGTLHTTVPDTRLMARAKPVLEARPGWQQPTTGARRWKDLPPRAQAYLERISELVGVPISMVGVGPHRDDTLVVSNEALLTARSQGA